MRPVKATYVWTYRFLSGRNKIGNPGVISVLGGQLFLHVGMISESIIYLVVWSVIAAAQGGTVGGYDVGYFVAYYIFWTLVRNMNIVFTPYGWE